MKHDMLVPEHLKYGSSSRTFLQLRVILELNLVNRHVHTIRLICLNAKIGGGGRETRPGTEKQCSHNLQINPLGSSFKKGRENFL